MLIAVTHLKLPPRLGRLFVLLAPSMFSVYLIHCGFMLHYFGRCESLVNEYTRLPFVACDFLLAIVMFALSVVLDVPRRVLVNQVRGKK